MNKTVKQVLYLLLGDVCASLALDLFLLPGHIAPGGFASLAAMLSSFMPLSVGLWLVIINAPFFLIGLRLDRAFFFKSLLGMAANALFIDLFAGIDPAMLGIADDLVLSAIFGGALMGVGYGLVLSTGGSSGGTDITGWLLRRKFPALKMGRAILLFDVAIILLQSFVYGNLKLSLYAIIAMYISSRIIDNIVEGGSAAKFAYIISVKGEEISRRIMAETGHGVTGITAKGMYTDNKRLVLLCTMHRSNVPQVKKIIREVDPEAFVILSDAREVAGEGFNPLLS